MSDRDFYADLKGHSHLKNWIVVVEGEGVQSFASREEAIASAKEQAEDIPNLVLGVYRAAHFVSARVQPAALFAPPPDKEPPKAKPARKAKP